MRSMLRRSSISEFTQGDYPRRRCYNRGMLKGRRAAAAATGLILPILLALTAPTTKADQPTSRPTIPDSFMRFVDDGQGGGSLQSAELVFVNPQGIRVHLIAAIHIGEKSYYDQLNQDFRQKDAVL